MSETINKEQKALENEISENPDNPMDVNEKQIDEAETKDVSEPTDWKAPESEEKIGKKTESKDSEETNDSEKDKESFIDESTADAVTTVAEKYGKPAIEKPEEIKNEPIEPKEAEIPKEENKEDEVTSGISDLKKFAGSLEIKNVGLLDEKNRLLSKQNELETKIKEFDQEIDRLSHDREKSQEELDETKEKLGGVESSRLNIQETLDKMKELEKTLQNK